MNYKYREFEIYDDSYGNIWESITNHDLVLQLYNNLTHSVIIDKCYGEIILYNVEPLSLKY